jgi:hypothetical protein
MSHGTCPGCGQEDVAISRAGKAHPMHVNSKRHQRAIKLAEQKELEAKHETDE